jgi:PAS domain S-box-containing protein
MTKALSLAASLLVAIIGAMVLVGWALDIEALKSVLPGLVSMKANTAIALLLSGVGLALVSSKPGVGWVRIVSAVIAVVVTALGVLTLGEYFFGWDLGIDQLFFHETGPLIWTSEPGRMAPLSAFCFVLMGPGLLAASEPISMRLRLPFLAGLGTALAAMGALAMAGAFAEGWLHEPWLNDSGIAVHTALSFLLLGSALLALAVGQRGLTWWLDGLVTTGIAIAVGVMVATAVITYHFISQLLNTAQLVSHRQEVLKEIQNVAAGMANLESGQRGFVILDDPDLIIHRPETEAAVRTALDHLRNLTADDPGQQQRLNQLEPMIGQQIAIGEQTINARMTGGFSQAEQMIATGKGIYLTQAINQEIKEMQDEEYSLLARDQEASQAISTSTFLILPLGVFLSLTISTLGLFFLNAGVGERMGMEKAWRESEERFQTVIENLTEGLVIANLDGDVLHWNPAALAMHGFPPDADWAGRLPEFRKTFELSNLDGTTIPGEQWPLQRIIKGANLRELPVRIRRTGTEWARVFSYGGGTVLAPGGEQIAFLTISDITERTRSEEALRESELQLGSFVEQAPVAMAMMDRNMVYLAASRRWVRDFGKGHEDLRGKCHYDLHPDMPPEWREIHRRGIEGISQSMDEELWERADGTRQWLRWAVQPWRDSLGQIGGIMILTENITARKEAERIQLENVRLEQENRRFEEASRLKSEFLANMSHELRTPLNGIIGFSELLADERPGPLNRKQQDYVGNVLNSGRHLLQLISDVLDLAKVEAGKLDFEPETFQLRLGIDEVCAVVRGMAVKKQVELRSETAPELGSVRLDPHRFKQICYNLLSNGVKFTDPGGSVEIVASNLDGGHFEVRVTDTGIGIREDEMDRLFREFEQLESGTSRRYEGTGLGLALTRKLVEMQGGRIEVRSEYGKGSSFSVVLPKEAAGEG